MTARKTIVSATKSGFTYTKSDFSISDKDVAYIHEYSQSYKAKYQRAKRNGSLAAKKALTEHRIEKVKAQVAFEKAAAHARSRYKIWRVNGDPKAYRVFKGAQGIADAARERFMSFGALHAPIPHLLSGCLLDVGSFNPCTDML